MALNDRQIELVQLAILKCDQAQLDKLVETFQMRSSVLRQLREYRALEAIQVDSRVRVMSAKPKYLEGLTGKVTKLDGRRVSVALDCGAVGKFWAGVVTFRSAGSLEVLEG